MKKISGWKAAWLAVAVMVLPLLGANVVRADSVSDKAATMDILGVHIGMTPAEAKSVLAPHLKDMRWVESKGTIFSQGALKGDIVSQRALQGTSEGQFVFLAEAQGNVVNGEAERVSVVFSTPPGDPKIVAVARDVSFDRSNAPTLETLTGSLTEKFGQASQKSQINNALWEFAWQWSKAGQISKPNPRNVCFGDELAKNLLGATRYTANWWLQIPVLQQEDDGECAVAVKAMVSINDKTGIASRLMIAIVDVHDALQAAVNTDNHVKQVAQAKREEAVKKAGANKPAL